MKKNVWIFNHYAINHFFNSGGRHYWFAKCLRNEGYSPTVFTSNIRHNSDDIIKMVDDKGYVRQLKDNLPFIFINTTNYSSNGFDRVKNMISFYFGLLKNYKKIIKEYGKPDVILASSVHPLTLVAGIRIAKKLGIPCICEIRDLWPESIVAYGSLNRDSLLAKILYKGEKWIYKKADSIIMTWEGGRDYIKDQGWDKDIELSKIHHINNGVVLDEFDMNSTKYVVDDIDLNNKEYKNIVYTGSIRKVNNIGLLLDAAKVIQSRDVKDVRFIIYGDGDERELLEQRCKDENIKNVLFKGRVDKKYIPSILKKSTINILHNSSTSLDKYGQSQNKMFEYLAAGKCIIQTYTTGYSLLEKYNSGVSLKKQNEVELAELLVIMLEDEKKFKEMGKNARVAAKEYDFQVLTDKLIDIINDVITKK